MRRQLPSRRGTLHLKVGAASNYRSKACMSAVATRYTDSVSTPCNIAECVLMCSRVAVTPITWPCGTCNGATINFESTALAVSRAEMEPHPNCNGVGSSKSAECVFISCSGVAATPITWMRGICQGTTVMFRKHRDGGFQSRDGTNHKFSFGVEFRQFFLTDRGSLVRSSLNRCHYFQVF